MILFRSVRQFDVPAFFLEGRRCRAMEIQDWVSIICQVGTLVFAALTYFKGKK